MVPKLECKKCKQYKPIFKFFRGNTCINGYNEYCNDCIKEALNMFLYKKPVERNNYFFIATLLLQSYICLNL